MSDRCYPWWPLYNNLKVHVKCTACDLHSLHFRRSMTFLPANWRLDCWVLHGMNGFQKDGNLWCYGRVSIALSWLLYSLSWRCLVMALLFYYYIALIMLFKARRLFSASWSAFTNSSILSQCFKPKEHVKIRQPSLVGDAQSFRRHGGFVYLERHVLLRCLRFQSLLSPWTALAHCSPVPVFQSSIRSFHCAPPSDSLYKVQSLYLLRFGSQARGIELVLWSLLSKYALPYTKSDEQMNNKIKTGGQATYQVSSFACFDRGSQIYSIELHLCLLWDKYMGTRVHHHIQLLCATDDFFTYAYMSMYLERLRPIDEQSNLSVTIMLMFK